MAASTNVITEPYDEQEDPADFLIKPHPNLERHLAKATDDDLIMLSEMIAYGQSADYSNQRHGFDGFDNGFVRRELGGRKWFEFVEREAKVLNRELLPA